MEPQTNDLFDDELQLDAEAKNHLKGMATWAMVIVVVAVLGYVISIIDAVVSPAYQIGAAREGFSASIAFGEKSLTGAIISTLIGIVIHFFLFRFSVLIGESVKTMDTDKAGAAIRNLKIYFAIGAVLSVLASLAILIGLVAVI